MASISARAEKPRDITRDQIDFEIHPLPGHGRAKVGACQSMRDDVHPEAGSGDTSLTVRLTPSTATEPFGAINGASASRRLENEADGFGFRPPLDDARDAVDMAGDEMPAQLVADPQRSFEIDRGALSPLADRRAGQGFGRCLDREFPGRGPDHRQAYPGTGDRGPDAISPRCRTPWRSSDRRDRRGAAASPGRDR